MGELLLKVANCTATDLPLQVFESLLPRLCRQVCMPRPAPADACSSLNFGGAYLPSTSPTTLCPLFPPRQAIMAPTTRSRTAGIMVCSSHQHFTGSLPSFTGSAIPIHGPAGGSSQSHLSPLLRVLTPTHLQIEVLWIRTHYCNGQQQRIQTILLLGFESALRLEIDSQRSDSDSI